MLPHDAIALRAANRAAVLRAVHEYNPTMVVAMDVDFGHTIPQWVLPCGGHLQVDGANRRIAARFGS